MNNPKDRRVAVALSGGVDSTYALLKLKEEGYRVEGVTLRIFCFSEKERQNAPYNPKACSSLDAVSAVYDICEKFQIPYHIINAKELFQQRVIDYFVKTYQEGQTPNPCVMCNKYIKWGYLRKKINEMGIKLLATGHYAGIDYNSSTKRYELIRDPNNKKDQTYMLWQLSQDDLENTLFPLGNLAKKLVRSKVAETSLEISRKTESQEICFIQNEKYTDFLEEHSTTSPRPGEILDTRGNVLGTHKGYWHYTIGQRRGLGISAPEPLYVLEIDPGNNQIIIGEKKHLFKKEVTAESINFIKYGSITKAIPVKAKIRYSQKDFPGMLSRVDEDKIKVVFDQSQAEIAPGQSLVAYEGDSVVAGGIIT